MNTYLRHALTSSLFLKALSLILGFLFWSILSDSFTGHRWISVPIAFYNVNTEKIACSAETIKVQLKGKRTHLKNLDTCSMALHIDAQSLKTGPQLADITADQFFLPATISIGETMPHAITVTVTRSLSEEKS